MARQLKIDVENDIGQPHVDFHVPKTVNSLR
jgi:hypothetical protein